MVGTLMRKRMLARARGRPSKRARFARSTSTRRYRSSATSKPRRVVRSRSRLGYKKRALRASGLSSFKAPACKQTTRLDQQASVVQSRTWGAVNLCSVPFASANVQNARCGQEASVVGVMSKINWFNRSQYIMQIYEYWIVPKNYDPQTVSDATLQDDFFTRHGQPADRDGSWAPNLASILYDEPVNPEKYHVLKKRKTTLGPSAWPTTGLGANMGSAPCYKEYKEFIKIGRKYTYGTTVDSETIEPPIQAPVFYVNFWIPIMTENGSVPTTGTELTREAHIVTYFRDGESGM